MFDIVVRNSRLVNSEDKTKPNYIYVGRPTALGNPFSHLAYVKNITLVPTPKVAVKEYEKWIRVQIDLGNQHVLYALAQIYDQAMNGRIYLMCWCKDELLPRHGDHECHAEVIRKIVIEEHEIQMGETNG